MGRKRTGGGNDERRIILDDSKIQAWHAEGKTVTEVSKIIGCSRPVILKAFHRLGLRRPAKPRPGVFSGNGNPSWSGGRRQRTDGYIEVWTPVGVRLEHQVLMERHLGRPLVRGEIVHHKDGNKSNNVIQNLELMTQSEHAKHHAPQMHAARYGHAR